MGRASQAQAQENRERVVRTASRLFREQGTHVSVADLMKAAGLTHGGFYKQFPSKEALIDEATAHAFGELASRRAAALEQIAVEQAAVEQDAGLEQGAGPEQRSGRRAAAQQALIDAYLSVEHRDNPAEGCPAAALAHDMAREPGSREARRVYAEGVSDFAAFLATEDQDGITRLCTMLGALVLARATREAPLSEDILTAARTALTETG
ncbi:TetR family transcriptional regulator [Streptomyces sp. BV286]|uniref:TetR/AcrR family transcriptional regulator n=1 Tax=Streptomyces sp. BV286 TaxID=2849672 RepID=UPI001C2EA880|nr:TetR family transcriptional regulator [Streptomyces sp. BV286]MBV1940402.1 TetR family transcriptional regulator [Streptomyces sp. BV286]